MPVKDAARGSHETAGRQTDNRFGNAHWNVFLRPLVWSWIAQILERRARTTPAVFEHKQPLVAPVRTPHIELQKPVFFGFLNSLPHQQLRGPKTMELWIGTTVFVGHRAFITD